MLQQTYTSTLAKLLLLFISIAPLLTSAFEADFVPTRSLAKRAMVENYSHISLLNLADWARR